MRRVLAVAVVVGLAWVAAPAGADAPRTLGEAAAREKEKKKGKVFTEDDLRTAGRGTYSQPGQGNTSEGTAAGEKKEGEKKEGEKAGEAAEKPKTEDELRAEEEKAWRDKLTQAQSDVTNWTGEVARLQALANDNTGPMYGAGRSERLSALENAKSQLAAAQTTVESLQEEGRRKRFR